MCPPIPQKIVNSGEFRPGGGRLGKGQYVADTPQGAIKEFKYHKGKDAPTTVVEIKYDKGRNLDLTSAQKNGLKPSIKQGQRIAGQSNADTITYQSIRKGGSANTVIRNGTAKPTRIIKGGK